MKWTDKAVAKLKAMHREGLEYSLIAKELGTTRSAICGKVARLGLPQRANHASPRVREVTKKRASATKVFSPHVRNELSKDQRDLLICSELDCGGDVGGIAVRFGVGESHVLALAAELAAIDS